VFYLHVVRLNILSVCHLFRGVHGFKSFDGCIKDCTDGEETYIIHNIKVIGYDKARLTYDNIINTIYHQTTISICFARFER